MNRCVDDLLRLQTTAPRETTRARPSDLRYAVNYDTAGRLATYLGKLVLSIESSNIMQLEKGESNLIVSQLGIGHIIGHRVLR